jgi:putative membrane protein
LLPVVSVQRVVMKVSRSVEYSYAVFGKYLKMIVYDSRYSKFFLGVPGMLLLIGGIGTVTGYTTEIFALLLSVLGGALLVRAFDIDRKLTNWSKPTPMGFIRMFTMVAGILLMLSSVPAGLNSIQPELLNADTDILLKISDKIIIGEYISGTLPILWTGLGAIFAGFLLSNWIGGIPRQISDSLRIIVLISLYPVIIQFTNIMTKDDSSFTLIPPLLGGLAATLISATILFKKYRKHKNQEMVND